MEPGHIVYEIRVLKIQTIVILISICIVRIKRITSFISRDFDALRHDVSDFDAGRSNPFLIWPFRQDLSLVTFREIFRIIAPILPRAGAEVAHHYFPLSFETCND